MSTTVPPIAPGCKLEITVLNTGEDLITTIVYPSDDFNFCVCTLLVSALAICITGLYWYYMKFRSLGNGLVSSELLESVNSNETIVAEEKRVTWREKLIRSQESESDVNLD